MRPPNIGSWVKIVCRVKVNRVEITDNSFFAVGQWWPIENILPKDSTEPAVPVSHFPQHQRKQVEKAFELAKCAATVTALSYDEMQALVFRALDGEFDKDLK